MNIHTQNWERMKFMVIGIVIGIILVLIGFFYFLGASSEDDTRGKISGVVLVVLAIFLILICIKTDNYTEWKETSESEIILQVENNKYVFENEKEYIYKTLKYTENGEKTEVLKHIEKNEGAFVEYVEIDQDEIASCSKFTRRNKTVLGFSNGPIQIKYVFYIPQN